MVLVVITIIDRRNVAGIYITRLWAVVTRRGTEVAWCGTEVTRRGTEVTRRGTEVAWCGTTKTCRAKSTRI